MTHYPTTTVFTMWRQCMNSAFKTIKSKELSVEDYFKGFIVLIFTYFTHSHKNLFKFLAHFAQEPLYEASLKEGFALFLT